jgi:hypothetical protein
LTGQGRSGREDQVAGQFELHYTVATASLSNTATILNAPNADLQSRFDCGHHT